MNLVKLLGNESSCPNNPTCMIIMLYYSLVTHYNWWRQFSPRLFTSTQFTSRTFNVDWKLEWHFPSMTLPIKHSSANDNFKWLCSSLLLLHRSMDYFYALEHETIVWITMYYFNKLILDLQNIWFIEVNNGL